MDPKTLEYYQSHAHDVAQRYESVSSPVQHLFASAFPAGARVLDIGCGSGRDLAQLLARGYDAQGVEPVEAMRGYALLCHPELQGRIHAGALPDLQLPAMPAFDGVLCCAVLMHLPLHLLPEAVKSICSVLAPEGRVLLSLPLTRNDRGTDGRDDKGRLFCDVDAQKIQALFADHGFGLIQRWDTGDALARAGTSWFTLLLGRRA